MLGAVAFVCVDTKAAHMLAMLQRVAELLNIVVEKSRRRGRNSDAAVLFFVRLDELSLSNEELSVRSS